MSLRSQRVKPLRVDSALSALSSLRGLRGAPEVPSLCRETLVSRTANVGTVGMNRLSLRTLLPKFDYVPGSGIVIWGFYEQCNNVDLFHLCLCSCLRVLLLMLHLLSNYFYIIVF